MSSDPDQELTDLQGNMAMKILQELLQSGKINMDKFEECKKCYQRLHDTILKTFHNQKQLPGKAKKMQAELKFKKDEFDQAQIKFDEAEQVVKKSQGDVKKTEAEEDVMKKILEQKTMELDKLQQQLDDQNNRLQEEKKEKRNKIQPQFLIYKNQTDKLKDDIDKKDQEIEQRQNDLQKKAEQIQTLKKDIDETLNEIAKLHNEISQIKDEPNRFQKKADMLDNANQLMNKDLETILTDIQKLDKLIADQKEKSERRNQNLESIEQQIASENAQIQQYDNKRKHLKSERQNIKNRIDILNGERQIKETELKDKNRDIRQSNDQMNHIKKEIQQNKKIYKKDEFLKNQYKEQIREYEISIDKYTKEEQEHKYELSKQQEIQITITDEIKLTEHKKRIIIDKTSEKDNEKDRINQQIQDLEKQLAKLQEFEAGAMKKVKMLTAMRESMARKASSAMAEVRETREELKIKELLILDLTKKHQETEFKLNSFKALYEEVKSARNKYVNLIQNSSQDLAELKERIKILQNELEILKNESQEKDSTLMQYKHILQLEIHKRDRAHAKLNKQEYIRKAKKEQVDQNINEIEKLNMIIMSLEKEMLVLRKKYEQACESRNYTGIQLIDRNDELCILYEKSNIQENILRNGEVEIKKLEDEIRMIKIEMNEKKRQIDVARKQILLVPNLADQVIHLKHQLELEQEREASLSKNLEDPENINRFRVLQGEDPDSEALDAKIHVLEERLNNKKEGLLEKELILDEITNLSEKLRKQALDGRQGTLELSEKLNDFQARLKDITRKMMANISELSMFQATAIKLQQERDDVEKVVDEAKKRMEQGMPPTQETEIEYLKQVRDRKRYEEERGLRMQREALEKNFPPFATKTTAEHRVNAYIPDEIGIPKPYGKAAPFKPSDAGANMRHFKKPKVKDIEI